MISQRIKKIVMHGNKKRENKKRGKEGKRNGKDGNVMY